ncbi:HdeD family acid-resistance protein [Streptomyces halobius]|uniref:HdeD family acid-resistance protein n=1 Tax=Streptomyces halobius TaxID=2879846 RepID=A0ABY4LYZ0_9ACTN|nr:HdeD family acid-resistance protein [Streptomyces halobius]UQA90683.1 HdeD family acid-resistance protein [Streptomyces halobius]
MSFSSNDPQAARAHGGVPHGGLPLGDLPSGLRLLANAGWQILLSTGVASIALGVVVLAWPGATLTVVGVLFGIYLLAIGFFQLAGAFGAHVPGHLRVLGFVSGALCVLLGLVAFRGPAQSLLLLALWIGFGWVLRGSMMTAMALSVRHLPARGWQIFLGVVNLLAGIVLVVSPFESIGILTLVAGIVLIVMGVIEVIHGIQLRIGLKKFHMLRAPAASSDAPDDAPGAPL